MGAAHAVDTGVPVDAHHPVAAGNQDGVGAAGPHTAGAIVQAQAFVRVYARLRIGAHPLGVAAPLAGERAALHEELRPDAGTVVNGEALHVEHKAANRIRMHSYLFFSHVFGERRGARGRDSPAVEREISPETAPCG